MAGNPGSDFEVEVRENVRKGREECKNMHMKLYEGT